ncbi:hypothetical protein SD457_18420 [Coprobacillaceae bacterium CR2/5/TPMF4]|nr:hypothetical protein SD457_18420 [Coprobacillaceae bacterium CR2/5/TPMF4]
MKFALMEQGVLDYGETFSLSENDFNHDGKKILSLIMVIIF